MLRRDKAGIIGYQVLETGGRAQGELENVGQERAAHRIDQADKDGRDKGAADRADAADDDDDKGKDQDVFAHADLRGQNGRLHQAGKTGKRGADPEHERVEQLDVDSERADHFAVRGAGPDQHADARAHHDQVEPGRHRQRHHDDGQPVHRVIDAGKNFDRGIEPGRQGQVHAGRSPDQAHQFVEEQDQAEGRQHVVEMVAAVQPAHGDHFDRHADQERRHQREQHAADKVAGPRREGRRKVGADHVERPVRQIDEIHDPENQRQSGRQQKQQQTELQPVQKLFDEKQHHSPLSARPARLLMKSRTAASRSPSRAR